MLKFDHEMVCPYICSGLTMNLCLTMDLQPTLPIYFGLIILSVLELHTMQRIHLINTIVIIRPYSINLIMSSSQQNHNAISNQHNNAKHYSYMASFVQELYSITLFWQVNNVVVHMKRRDSRGAVLAI